MNETIFDKHTDMIRMDSMLPLIPISVERGMIQCSQKMLAQPTIEIITLTCRLPTASCNKLNFGSRTAERLECGTYNQTLHRLAIAVITGGTI